MECNDPDSKVGYSFVYIITSLFFWRINAITNKDELGCCE